MADFYFTSDVSAFESIILVITRNLNSHTVESFTASASIEMIEHVTRLFKRGYCWESSFELRAVDRCHVKSQTWTELCVARLNCTENNVMRISLIENNSQLVVNPMMYLYFVRFECAPNYYLMK